MPAKPEPFLATLPRWEITLYWALSLGSHLYSFYEVHCFSKEHERGLDREFPLEKGFLIWGLKRDAADFEWSFWGDWAKKSLLYSLIGHAMVSRLASLYLPQWHLAILTGYGVLAACHLLGLRGVAVLMLQLSVSLAVAQLHSPVLCWASSLLLLSTLHITSLQDIQRAWYESEDQYYLLLFSVAVCGLRCISFSLEFCWSASGQHQHQYHQHRIQLEHHQHQHQQHQHHDQQEHHQGLYTPHQHHHHRCQDLHPQHQGHQHQHQQHQHLLHQHPQCCPLQAGGAQQQQQQEASGQRCFFTQLYRLSAYCFYHPLFFNGPVIMYRDFSQQMLYRSCRAEVCVVSAWGVFMSVARVCVWWCVAETLIHTMHMHSIQSNETYLEILPPWALGGLALALVQFFYVKYLVLFGVPSLLARLDGLQPPTLPRCVSIMYSFSGMWRHFDVGLYKWLIRYIYVPLGGSRRGQFRKVVSTALAFGFVCFWHGGHDYLRQWALLNWAGVLLENAMATVLTSPPLSTILERVLSPPMRRRGLAFVSAFSTGLLILSNLIFLGGDHVGRIFWKRVFVRGWSNIAIPMLGFLYCFAQVGLEWDRTPR
ncbi:protein-cysteine N-palmitoyltransferase HHAT [Engraulis encrasicolus]|uniref:protein-cysteine N-palmitoyltransferase HHAT n=1 Tax=Engraulis encrasicolus TaxID=184585 RepID=UPI002FD138F4